MNPADIILAVLILAIAGGALLYIRRAKKKGNQCIGCPHSGTCHSCSQHK